MPITVPMDSVFRVAAGPRVGFGHLVRCRSLARAMGVEARVSIRGTAATRRLAARLGWTVVAEPFALGSRPPRILIVDDPDGAECRRWVARAARANVPVASLHDAGSAWPARAALAIDGSAAARPATRPGDLCGPRYAVLDPRVRAAGRRVFPPRVGRVLVALGGGAHTFAAIRALAAALARRCPDLELRVARGFTTRRVPAIPRVQWIEAPHGLAAELARADLAIVAGGVTLYEACALGTPAVAVAMVPGQRPAVRAAAAAGAVVASGARFSPARVAARVARLAASAAERRRLSTAARRLVDGRGSARVAAALARLAAVPPRAADLHRDAEVSRAA